MNRPAASEAFELLTLDALPGVGPATVLALVRRFGSAASALRAPEGDFAAVANAEAARLRRDPALRGTIEAGLDAARACGSRVFTWSDAAWPEGLRHLADPPPVLFLRGDPSLLERAAVTVVGSRRSTERARDVARRLGREIARSGRAVVSGLALGVDGAAHRGALTAGGATVAVLGTGPDIAYPRAHRRLFEEIVTDGLVVSEFLPGTGALPHHFPRRNRILAALSEITVVVEAGARSGALITVDHALDLGREVWAVPGPIDRAACAGSNRLLVDGARPLVSIRDFVAALPDSAATIGASAVVSADGRGDGVAFDAPGGGGEADAVEIAAADPAPAAASPEARVLDAIEDEPLHVDDVADRARLPVETALALLTTLELFGEVERLPGMRFRRAA